MGERLLHEAEARRERELPARAAQLVEQRGVVGDVRDGGDADEVLRGGADHAGAADVDVGAALLGGDAGPGGYGLERIEVADDHVDLDGARAGEVGLVGVVVVLAEEAEVDLEVEGLHEAALHLGLAGVVGDGHEVLRGGGAEGGLKRLVGAAGAVELHAGAGLEEALDEGLEAGLVKEAHQDVADGNLVVDLLDDVECHGLCGGSCAAPGRGGLDARTARILFPPHREVKRAAGAARSAGVPRTFASPRRFC